MKPNTSGGRRYLIVFCFAVILSLCVLAAINELEFDSLKKLGKCAFSNPPPSGNSSTTNATFAAGGDDDEIRILIGILTRPDSYDKRHFLRLIYGTQSPAPGARIDVKFVFCNLTKDDQRVLVALEIMRYGDIIILDCKENMDNGKTYTYFSTLPELFPGGDSSPSPSPSPPYHYVMKADDDTYLRLENLVESLRPLPRKDLYFGYVIPCPSMDPFVHYMSGMGYLISWDLAEWIRDSEIPKKNMVGPEDKLLGEWLRDGRRAKNRFNGKWSMYNFPEPATQCTHELWPETIAVHLLKTQEKWIRTLEYFNVTVNLKPSKLYHIP